MDSQFDVAVLVVGSRHTCDVCKGCLRNYVEYVGTATTQREALGKAYSVVYDAVIVQCDTLANDGLDGLLILDAIRSKYESIPGRTAYIILSDAATTECFPVGDAASFIKLPIQRDSLIHELESAMLSAGVKVASLLN